MIYENVSYHDEHLLANSILICSIFLCFLFVLFLFFCKEISYERGYLLQGVVVEQAKVKVVVPSSMERVLASSSFIKIQDAKREIKEIQLLQNSIVEGVFYTECFLLLEQPLDDYFVSHYYEMTLVQETLDLWEYFKMFFKEVL